MSLDQKWRPGPSVGGITDRSTGGGNNESEELSILIDQNAESRHQMIFSEEKNQLFDYLDKALVAEVKAGQADEAKPKIQQVPIMLRERYQSQGYFKPKVISVGPYHYKDTNLKISGQPIKLKLAAMFIKETQVNKEDLYGKIMNQIMKLSACYDNEATKDYPDHKLALIFLVDGCAILQFMHIFSDYWFAERKLRELGIKTDHAAFGHHDLFLLDNQLPYELLQLIMQFTGKEEKKFLHSIHDFIFDYTKAPGQKYVKNDKILEENHVHLLDLMRKLLIQPLQNNKKLDCREAIIRFVTVNLFGDSTTNKKSEFWHSFRNIEELRSAGIKLRPSETSGVRDITFIWDTLKLPPIVVKDSTAAKFLNMAAYEMCPDFHNGFEVSSYICFLDSLIDQAKDVKTLREKKILHNALGSDEEVAKLFNEISRDLVLNEKIYLKVKSNIQKYCNSIWMKWLSQFFQDLRDYFKGRWSLIAFIGAFVALASSIIQTVYTVLGYHDDSNKGN